MRLIAFIVLLLANTPIQAAEVTRVLEHEKYPHISIDGPLEQGDLRKVLGYARTFLEHGEQIELLINSAGGDLLEAIEIGKFVRETYAQVKVRGNYIKAGKGEIRHCYSACVVILAGAANRDHEMDNEFYDEQGYPILRLDNGKRIEKIVPVIGVHRPFFKASMYSELSPQAAEEKYKAMEMSVKQFLRDSNAPDAFISRMFKSASNEIDLIPKSEFMAYFPYEEPFLEEWFIAKCGALESGENKDFISLLVDRAMNGGKIVVPAGMSQGYVSYLFDKHDQIRICKATALLQHQGDVLKRYEAIYH